MAHLLPNYPRVSSNLRPEPPRIAAVPARAKSSGVVGWGGGRRRSAGRVLRSSNSGSISATEDLIGISEKVGGRNGEVETEYLANEHGWKVRKLIEEEDDLRVVARIQAEAFHERVPLFNDFFFRFFQAEVLSALIYRLKNYPSDRYACLVAEPEETEPSVNDYKFVGVVDVTVAGDLKVKRHLPAGVREYLFVSGIAVSETVRRRKVGTALLKGCDMLARLWGFKFLALSAYEDDEGARSLYSKAGYQVISADPPWISSWFGRKRCVTMLKIL